MASSGSRSIFTAHSTTSPSPSTSHAVAVAGHRHDPQVDRRGQAAVEADLLLAEVAALLQRAEVEEAQVDRLLDLVGIGPGQEDDRDVRLADLHRLDRIERVGGRVGEGLDQCGPGP